MSSEWLKAEEVCAAMRLTTEALYAMVRDGQFTLVKWKGREVRIHRSEVYPEVVAVQSPRLTILIDDIRRRLDELDAQLRAS